MTALRTSGVVGAALLVLAHTSQPARSDLDRLLRTGVDRKQVPFAVAMVAGREGVIFEAAHGIGRDAIFPIASMTKPITSVALMQLVERGRVKLDAPASTYVPELAAARVLDHGALRAPKTPVTVRHLLTHTSGFGYEFLNGEILDLVARKELGSVAAGDDAFMRAPLLFDPGTRWQYGISTDWLGRVIERVSGQTLEQYFREHIFDPLGMSDSFFVVPAGKQARIAPAFSRGPDGALNGQPLPPPPSGVPAFYSGGGGLHSTASDYLRFVRALMAGGVLDGRRILTDETAALLGRNQIGALSMPENRSLMPQIATDRAVMPGALDKFGLGFALNSTSKGTARGVNTMSWSGIFNTFFWIDREKRVGAVFMTRMLPWLDPGVATLLEDFDRAVYAAVGSASAP
jgi:CubicO group peptidase (beta-lactamase class C family)